MNSKWKIFARHYAGVLQSYLKDEQEATLHLGYELGRRAIARGLGVLDMAKLHMDVLETCVLPKLNAQNRDRALKAAETFFLEALSPFEVTHRGFRETNLKLKQVVETLEMRNAELAEANGELAIEVEERKRTEKALRESETHFRQLFHRAELMQEDLRNLSNQILHAQEEERKRISRELHDEIGQALTAIHVQLVLLQTDGAANSPFLRNKVADTQHLLEQSMESVHRFARELRPAMLDELGLLPALRSYVMGFAERTGLRVRFRAAAAAESLDSERKTVVFRVAQESLTNVAKHAQASRVDVSIRKLKDGVQMEIKDNGRSFQEEAQGCSPRKKRLGLLGMQERVRLVNGRFSIEPKPGKGTRVRVEIPTNGNLPLPFPDKRLKNNLPSRAPHKGKRTLV